MTGWLLFIAISAAPAANPPKNMCTRYVGQQPTMTPFDDILAKLPKIPPRDAYETSAAYDKRVAAAAMANTQPFFIRRTSANRSMSYNADKGTVTVYPTELGIGQINFSDVFRREGSKGNTDYYSGPVAFQVSRTSLREDTYEGTNGYGAKVMIEREFRRVDAVWERAGKLGESPLTGKKPFGPIAKLTLPAADAKDLIEAGSTALVPIPKAPYTRSGASYLRPTFDRPREKVDEIRVLIADVQCAFLLNGSGTVAVAFEVK